MALFDKLKKKKEEARVEKKEEKKVEKDAVSEKKEKAPGKKISKSEIKRKASAYNIIQEPCITEKASFLTEQNKYVFRVYPDANKSEIKKAVESIYDVKVEKVRIIRTSPKKRRLGRREGWRGGLKKGYKKAVVGLKKGDKIELMPR